MTLTRPPATQPLDYPMPSNRATRRSSASQRNTWNINQPMPWLVLLAIIAGVSLALSISARDAAIESERETRMLEFYLLELDAKLVAAGYKTDAESLAKRLRKEEN